MKNTQLPYSPSWFAAFKNERLNSSAIIAPLVLEFVQPDSIIDIGCGTGNILHAFQQCGISDILGIDGDYVERSQLAISPELFRPFNLEQPFTIERSFDLAISLEVAEHLAPECAETFIASLVQLAPVVLFSAAIPRQGGTHHVNERWQDYWAGLFAKHGYVPVDALRRRLWTNDQVKTYYRQNMLFYCCPDALANNPRLRDERAMTSQMLSVVHPEVHMWTSAGIPERVMRLVKRVLHLPLGD